MKCKDEFNLLVRAYAKKGRLRHEILFLSRNVGSPYGIMIFIIIGSGNDHVA